MRTIHTIKKHLSYGYAIVRNAVRWLYIMVLAPRALNEDERRRERILLIVLFGVVLLTLSFEIFLIGENLFFPQTYNHISIGIFSCITFLFIGLLFAARKGFTKPVSKIFIGLYFVATLYGSIMWGASLPIGLLSYALVITMASILIGTQYGIATAGMSVLALIGIGSYEAIHQIVPVWKQFPIGINDIIEYGSMLGMSALLSWLYNTELEEALHKTKKSERALSYERDNLERLIEERTIALQTAERERIMELSRFAEFGKVSAGLFHDLMSPLTAVALSIEHLNTENDKMHARDDAKEAVAIAVRATKRIEEYMSTFRNHVRTKETRTDFSIQQEIKIAFGTLHFKAREQNVLLEMTHFEDETLFGDPIKFNQIVNNLVSNAIDAYRDTPYSYTDERERKVTVSLTHEGNYLCLSVTDTGIGMSENTMRHIFEHSFSTKETGTGIGLSVVKDILEKEFPGTINVSSQENIGTTVTIHIPKR